MKKGRRIDQKFALGVKKESEKANKIAIAPKKNNIGRLLSSFD